MKQHCLEKKVIIKNRIQTIFFSRPKSAVSPRELAYCRIGNKSEGFILPTFYEWGQFCIMKVGCIIPVIRILTFNIGFS